MIPNIVTTLVGIVLANQACFHICAKDKDLYQKNGRTENILDAFNQLEELSALQ